eukprot:m.107359 g.107359  ORF g.107359 m.107359 type:complete len:360 (+) comp27788_c0_seq1:140-1219(+)
MMKHRVLAAIRGAFVADAASLGTHWIYDPAEMLKAVLDVNAPEFRDPASPRFYSADEFPGHYLNGMLSPYGEQLLFVVEHVASTMKQDFSGAAMSQGMLAWSETFGGRPDSALKKFVENMKKDDQSGQWPNCGADDDQAHIYMKVIPVTCRYAGSAELVDKITQAVQVHQNNQAAIAFGVVSARILEAVLLGASIEEALATAQQKMMMDLKSSVSQQAVVEAFARGKKDGLDTSKSMEDIVLELSHENMKGKEDSPFYNLAARSCALPGAFIAPIALFYKSTLTTKSAQETVISGIRENILISGDTCSRAIFIGAVLAASLATKESTPIPDEWMEKVNKSTMHKVNDALEAITVPIKSD